MKEWFVAHTHPCKEYIAEKHLLEQGFGVYIPRYQRTRRHARRTDITFSPLFPRYLFIEFDRTLDYWRTINSTRGIAYLLRTDGKPAPIPPSVISHLKAQENKDGILPLVSLALFVKGEQVRITEGAFAGYTAYFESMDEKQRVHLLLNFLGRETHIRLPLHTLEAA